MNKLILGDCLEVLQKLEPESIDLIYIDPPFFSNRTYEVIWGDKGEVRSFEDRFSGGIDHYISWLKERVQALHQLLKPTGSIFVHCDWHADAYIRVHILDKIFGINNFRGDIVWQRTNTHNDAKKKLSVITDTIWYYSKSTEITYNPIYIELSENYKANFYKYRDEKGVYQLADLSKPDNQGYKYEYKGYLYPVNGWRCPLETMQKLDNAGLLHFPKNKTSRIRLKRYLDDSKGTLLGSLWIDKNLQDLTDEEFNAIYNTEELGNIWADIQNVQGASKEKIGYPTQKPEALLERIIKMATNEGDTVLDCFMGGGTTIAVADKLNRKWIGIDQSVNAVKVTEFRLNTQQGLFSKPFTLTLHKYDYDTLRYKDAFEFESWIVGQFGGIANTKQRGDLGIDGYKKALSAGQCDDSQGLGGATPIQVKRSDNIGREVIDKFKSACERFDKTSFEKHKAEQKSVGFIIAFSFGKGAIQEIGRLKNEENIVIKLVTVEEIVPIAKKPALEIEMIDKGLKKDLREIEFVATAKSETGIEFYSWDFEFNETQFLPQILRDTEGKQTYQFKAGEHKIAVKVVDGEGLESIEIVKLKVNGDIKRK